MFEFNDQVVIVTGSGSPKGIGRTIARTFAKQGATVVIADMNEEGIKDTVAVIEGEGGKAMGVTVNVTSPESVQQMVDTIMEKYGRIDVLVNNAGIARDGLLMTAKEEDFSQTLDTNLKGAYFCTKAAAKVMLRQKYGRIVCLSSVVGLRGNPGQTAYAASKAGVIGLVKAAAKELAGRDITVNAVAPGFIETDMTAVLPEKAKAAILGTIPKGRPGSPEEVARAVAFFAGPECAYITGQVLCVDGGMAV